MLSATTRPTLNDGCGEAFARWFSKSELGSRLGAAPRRVICLNAINNDYEQLVCGSIAGAGRRHSQLALRHGFVLPKAAHEDWQPSLLAGEAGIRTANGICAKSGAIGSVAYSPYKELGQRHVCRNHYFGTAAPSECSRRDAPCFIRQFGNFLV